MPTEIPATLRSHLKAKKVIPIKPFLAPITERSYKAAYEQACNIINDLDKLGRYLPRVLNQADPSYESSMAKIRVFHYREDGSVDEDVVFVGSRTDAPSIVDRIREVFDSLEGTAPAHSPRSKDRSPDK